MNSIRTKFELVVIRIKERRILLNYTQQYVAGRLKISQNAYSKIESGRAGFTVERLYQIAEVLQVEVQHLID